MADNSQLNIQITAEDLTTAVLKGISEGFGKIETSLQTVANPAKTASSGIASVGDAASKAQGQSNLMTDTLGGMAFAFNNIVSAAQTAWAALNRAIEPALTMERLNTVLKSATGSTQEAGAAFEFVKSESARLGLDLQSTAAAFSKVAIAAKGTSLEGEASKKMFTGFAEAFAALRLTTDQTNSVFAQLTQGMNKGKLELEDLKIMAEAGIPIFKMLAEAMGKTQPEIMAMISNGQLLANEVYPKLADSMHKTFGADAAAAAQGTQAELARVKNEAFLASAAFAQDLLPAATVIFKALAAGIETLSAMVDIYKVLTSAVFGFAFAMSEVSRAVLSGDLFSGAGLAKFRQNMGDIKDTFLKSVNGMDSASAGFYKSEEKRKAEAAESEKRRLQENKDALAANVAAQEKFIKTVADQETQLTYKHKLEYEEKKKTINNYYELALKSVVKDSAEWVKLTKEKTDALTALERENATTRAQIQVELRDRAVKEAATAAQQQIALVENRLARQLISERQAASEITAINKTQAAIELKLAEDRVAVMATAGLKGSDEYKKALDGQVAAQKAYNAVITQELKNAEEQKKVIREGNAADFKAQLTKEQTWLQEALNNRGISEANYRSQQLQAEVDYANKILNEKRRIAAETNPNNISEYKKALAEQESAELAYTQKYGALVKEREAQSKATLEAITTKAKEESEKRIAIEQAEQQRQSAFAASFFALWDNAYKSASDSLKALSTGAYNAWAQAVKQPLLMVESIDSLKQKSEEAQRAFNDMYTQNKNNALAAGAIWGPTLEKLGSITVEAARVTAEFLNQKVAAFELGTALENPVKQTASFLDNAAQALRGMTLLDQSTLDKLNGEINKVRDAMLAFTDKIRAALKALQDEFDNLTMNKLQLEEKRYQEQKAQWQKDFNEAQKQQNTEALVALNQQLDLIEKIHRVKEAEASTAPSKKFATGGWVPGSGSGDTVPAMLTPGEFVIRKSAVQHWGAGMMERINAMMPVMPSLPAGPRLAFAGGGMVPEVSMGGNSTTVNQSIKIEVKELNEATVRREVIPVLEKYARLKG